MPVYEWKGFDSGGKKASGVIDADSPRDARTKCKRQQMLVTDVVEIKGGKKKRTSLSLSRKSSIPGKENKQLAKLRNRLEAARGRKDGGIRSKGRTEEVSTFTRQLATLTRAGIPITEALRAIIEQTENKRLNILYRDIREKIAQGAPTADALAAHPDYFDQLNVSMVRAGEASGHLDEVLLKMSNFMQEQAKVRNKVQAAMMYPLVMLAVGLAVVALLIAIVVPKITLMLENQGSELPLPTRILQGASDFLIGYWWVIVIVGIFSMLAFNLIYSSDKGRLRIDTILLGMPIFGDLLKKQAIARFSQTFATLLASGVPVVRCLEVNRTVLGNRLMENTIDDVRQKIIEGADIAGPIRASGVFPPLLGYMIAVGEQSGELDSMMLQIGDSYQEEVEIATQKLTSLIEPILILVLAVMVGFIIMAILWPVLQMTQNF
ncbi:MAG: type II secretion system F family protein [Planctomycetota bacterium]|jgi:general secretion pathway protein F